MFCQHCGKETADEGFFCQFCGKPFDKTKSRPTPTGLVFLGVFIGILIAVLAFQILRYPTNSTMRPIAPPVAPRKEPVRIPMTDSIVNQQLIVKSGSYIRYTITIRPEMENARLVGNFRASGGAGNDIMVVVADEMNFENFANGHEYRAYYASGKVTVGEFNLRLAQGTYILGFSNTFSIFTDKSVFTTVRLNYELVR